MEISVEAYNGMSWNERVVIVDEIQLVPLEGASNYYEWARETANRNRYINKRLKIEGRYDSQRFIHKGKALMNSRVDWTPAQKRRIRKQGNKWRKRIMGED